jgi:potassium-transporting ATPase KdpC subunit
MIRVAIRSLLAVAVLAVLTGLVYPLLITGVAQVAMSDKADGSLISANGRVVGSDVIGQMWTGDQWFYGRPSAINYDASTSAGSNLGPNSAVLAKQMSQRVAAILKIEGPYNPGLTASQIPADLVTASASGLDPDISEAAALLQVNRIAAVRSLPVAQVRALVVSNLERPTLGFLGETRVNVLELNLALSGLKPS